MGKHCADSSRDGTDVGRHWRVTVATLPSGRATVTTGTTTRACCISLATTDVYVWATMKRRVKSPLSSARSRSQASARRSAGKREVGTSGGDSSGANGSLYAVHLV